MKKIIIVAVLAFSIYVIGSVLSPFGLIGNPALLKNDGTLLLKASPVVDIQFYQNLLTINNINALLNEEEIVISPQTMQNVIQNGISFSIPVNIATYIHLNLFGLRVIPYATIDGSLNLKLPRTFSQLLFDNQPTLGNTLEDTVQNFMKSNLRLSAGGNIFIGDFFVNASAFAPFAYSHPENNYAHARYTSSATPAYVNVIVDAKLSVISSFDLDNLGERLGNLEELLGEIQDQVGINIGFGYGNERFGFAIKDITIRPAKASYVQEFGINAYATYQAEATNITYNATYTITGPISFKLLDSIEVSDIPKITMYLKNDGFFMWGISGMYALDGDWAAKAYAGLSLGILKAYYVFGAFPVYYSHTVGLGFNLGLLNGDLQLTATTDSLNPIGSTTPGFGVSLRLAAGL